MRKLSPLICFIAILIVAIPTQGISQSKMNVSFGLRSHFSGMKGINNVIDHYNETRPWLDNTLGNQNFQNGFEIGLEKSSDDFGISYLKYFRVWNTSSAKGTTPAGVDFKRKLKTRVAGLEIVDFWYTPIHIGGLNIGGGIMPMGGGMFRVRTKIAGEKWKKLPLSGLEFLGEKGIFSTYHPFSNFHIDVTKNLNNSTLHIQFLYSRNWFQDEYNLIYVNRELNPSSYSFANYRQIHGQNNYAFKLTLVI